MKERMSERVLLMTEDHGCCEPKGTEKAHSIFPSKKDPKDTPPTRKNKKANKHETKRNAQSDLEHQLTE